MEQQNKENIQTPVDVVIPTVQPLKQNNTLVIILSVLLLISTSVSGYFAYQTQTLVKELTALKNTTEPTPIITTDPFATGSATVTSTENWKTYTNNEFGFQMKYPPAWKLEVDKNIATNANREFRFKTEKNEYISGVIYDGPTGYIQELEDWEKKLNTRNGDPLFISYTDNIGPGSKGGTIDLELFNIFASTFKFTNTVDEGVEIKALFEKVNKVLNTKITIDEQNSFYDSRFGQINKKSWLLDLSDVINDKSKVNLVEEVLISSSMTLDPTRSAGGSEASVDAFVGDNTLCYLIIEPLKKKLNCAVNK